MTLSIQGNIAAKGARWRCIAGVIRSMKRWDNGRGVKEMIITSNFMTVYKIARLYRFVGFRAAADMLIPALKVHPGRIQPHAS
jgi:hypothetical protein